MLCSWSFLTESKFGVRHHHHRHRFNVHFSMLAQAGWFPPNELLHLVLSCAHSELRKLRFKVCRSCLTHSSHVFLCLPLLFGPATSKLLQSDTQSSLPFRLRCPNNLSRPRLTISAISSKPKRPFESLLNTLFLRLTPHIHLAIIHSVLSKRFNIEFGSEDAYRED